MSEWEKKDEWWKHGKDFMVCVKHYTVKVDESAGYDSDMGHRWNVYAYIYPKHPHFAAFEGPRVWQDASSAMPLHGGPSLLKRPMFDGKVTSVQVGSDYNHLHDWEFCRMATQEEAYRVFADAEELFNWLQERSK